MSLRTLAAVATDPKANPPAPIERIVIQCTRDAAKPGDWCAKLVIEPGKREIPCPNEDKRGKDQERATGVFDSKQRPTPQALSLLIWLAAREDPSLSAVLEPAVARRLRGWKPDTTEGSIATAISRIIGDSAVLSYTNNRAWIQPGIQVVIEPEADRDEILRWAGVLSEKTEAPHPPAKEPKKAPDPRSAVYHAPPKEPTQAPDPRSAEHHAPPREPSEAPDARFAEYLAKLEADLHKQLASIPHVARELGCELHLPASDLQGPDDRIVPRVVNGLIHHATGKTMVMALHAVDEKRKGDPARLEERRALWRILKQTLPFASDWEHWRTTGRSALHGGKRFVDLPYCELTIAEVILAGIDCRPIRYEGSGNTGPSGPALIRAPVAESAYLSPSRFAEATVGLLAVQLLGIAPDSAELRDEKRIARRVNEVLLGYIETTGDRYLPRWLVVDEKVLSQTGTNAEEERHQRIAAVMSAISGKLPFLRILALGDGVDGETNLAFHIDTMWRKHGRND